MSEGIDTTATTDFYASETLAMQNGRPVKVTYGPLETLGGLGYTVVPHPPTPHNDR